MKIFKSAFAIFSIIAITYGVFCMVSEAEPWSPEVQILLFFRGLLILSLGIAGLVCVEGSSEEEI